MTAFCRQFIKICDLCFGMAEVVQILSSDDEESKEKEMPLKTDADSAENQQPTSSAVPSTSNNSQSNDMVWNFLNFVSMFIQ